MKKYKDCILGDFFMYTQNKEINSVPESSNVVTFYFIAT